MQTIGKYHIVKVLGHGGMGTVYEAVDPLIRRKVALKTMIPERAETAELRARFLREAQAAGGLRHRNIVTVYDLGEEKGRPYIAMEFIEGTDLEKVIQNREPYPIEWKLDILGQICEGLSYAHRNGIVHRDVKPANIRVTPEGEVKIMDFGIAHLQSSTLTKSGLVLGTVHYMSPEQIDGLKVDHRADVFSVGAIAYELLSYRKPFDGETVTGVMFKIMHEHADLGVLPATPYSPGLERIVMKALERNVELRYQSLDEMHDDLAALVRETAAKVGAAAGAEGAAPAAEERPVTLESRVASELEMRRGRASKWVADGRAALQASDLARARECADQALALVAHDEAARQLALEVESETLRTRVEGEMAEIRAEMAQARAAGQLQRAVGLCRRLRELDPDDAELSATEAEIQGTITQREVEQLSSQALAYAADGDVELAQRIAARIGKMAPDNPTYIELRQYLDHESRRTQTDALTATAQEHLAQGELAEARAAAEEALLLQPDNTLAREIRDRAAEVLARRGAPVRAEKPPTPEPEPLPVPIPVEPGPPPAPEPDPVVAPEVVAAAEAAGAAEPEPVPEVEVPVEPDVAAEVEPAVEPAVAAPVPEAVAEPAPEPEPEPVVAAPVAVPAAATPSPEPAAAAPLPAPVAARAAVAEPVPVAEPQPEQLTPLPEGEPSHPEAVALLDAARRLLRERAPQKALPLLEQAAVLDPAHQGIARLVELTRVDARRAEAAALTTAALNHFVQNNYGKARKAVEKALALEPENKKARELIHILGALG